MIMKQLRLFPKKAHLLCCALALCALVIGAHAQSTPNLEPNAPTPKGTLEIKATPPVRHVTVFLSGAEVVREGNLAIPKGNSEIILTGISPYADAKSIQVKLTNRDVTVLSVNHMYDHLSDQELSEDMLKWQKSWSY